MSWSKIIGDNRIKRISEMGHEEKGRISLSSLGVCYTQQSLFSILKNRLFPEKAIADERIPVIFLSNNDKVFAESATFIENRNGVIQDHIYDILCICTITEDGRRQYTVNMSEHDAYFLPEYTKAEVKKRWRHMKLASEWGRIVSGVPESIVMKNKIIATVRNFCTYIMHSENHNTKDIEEWVKVTCDFIFWKEYTKEKLISLLHKWVENILDINLSAIDSEYDTEVVALIEDIQKMISEIEEASEKYYDKFCKGGNQIEQSWEWVETENLIEESIYKLCERIIGETGTAKVATEADSLILYINSLDYSNMWLRERILRLHIHYSASIGGTDTLDEDIGPMIDNVINLCENCLQEDDDPLLDSLTTLYTQNNVGEKLHDNINKVMDYICLEPYDKEELVALIKTHITTLDDTNDMLQWILESYKEFHIKELKSILSHSIENENYEAAAKISNEVQGLWWKIIDDANGISISSEEVTEEK